MEKETVSGNKGTYKMAEEDVKVEKTEGEVTEDPIEEWTIFDVDKERFYSTRQRVRNATIPEGTVFYPARPKPSILDKGEKTVAVYARVSTKREEQVSSIENQTKYYTEKIAKNPNWIMQEIYADEGKTGTSMKKREEFRRMLQDAYDKKMDLILCASVSRFARNITDCMEQISNLRTANPSHPVGVYFETENIYTLDPDCNQALSIHAMLADWESDNKSRRMILSYDQRICTGQFPVADLLGYRHTTEGDLVIVEDEAVTVRFIFFARLKGCSLEEIAEMLTEKKRKTLKGRTEWNKNMVREILSNERRWGDLKARKRVVVDYKKGKTVKNNGIREAAFVPNHHEGIVTREIAKAAQMMDSNQFLEGVPEVKVIDSGGLKGFISINPAYKGMNRESLRELSTQIYSEEEREAVFHQERILSGDEHSKIEYKEFHGYAVPSNAYFIGSDTPVMTFTGKKLRFNRKCHERLFGCSRVELLYHPMLQTIILRECGDGEGFLWNAETGKPVLSICSNAFCSAVYEEMDWIPELSFRIRGITKEREGKRILVFYLDEPQILSNAASKKIAEMAEERGMVFLPGHIPFRNRDLADEKPLLEKILLGNAYAERKKRDALMDHLTREDILAEGVHLDNPFIGRIPTKEEVDLEFEKLMMSM